MLVLKLKKSDVVRIGEITLEIKDAGAGRVRIAFGAPDHVSIRNEPGDPEDTDACGDDPPRAVIIGPTD